MWIKINANPGKRRVGDCVIRAISVATGRPWLAVYDELYELGRMTYDMMSSNETWGLYLYKLGFDPVLLPDACRECVTVRDFARMYSEGSYIVGTGSHAVAVVDGDWYDTWDSGDTVPKYFFEVR